MLLRALALLLPVALGPSVAVAAGLAVLHDGSFREWRRLDPVVSDPGGDGASDGLDLGRLWLADDGEALYLRLEIGRETILQNPPTEAAGNELRLYLDLDDDTATGRQVEGLGAEMEVRFGERRTIFYDPSGAGESVDGGRAGVVALPTHSSEAFEIRVALPAAAERLALVLADAAPGGDRLPDTGAAAYRLSGKAIGPPRPIPLSRKKRTDFRLLSLNVEDSLIAKLPAVYRRLLRATDPDLIALQSLRDWGPAETLAFVEETLPPPDGRRWTAVGHADLVTLSTFPLLASAPVDGNLAVHVDLPADRDLVLVNVHLPCCANDAGRDAESDNLALFWRDLLEGRGLFPVAPDDAVIYAGDFNFVGFRRQLLAVRDGRFVDPSHGPGFDPGRARGRLATAPLRHVGERTTVTWRRTTSPFAPGRLDFVFYAGDALKHRRSYVLDTTELAGRDRRRAGLRRADTDRASDHLPLVADFRVRSGLPARPARP
ncbi:MAG: endonuclease/exonuclease/phosphatase family protein [Thermoanaerobaculia bacterium]|nr:endonuclease/exonuclease/phosphatase family protein [Thermoanaerobaculia bacterium]